MVTRPRLLRYQTTALAARTADEGMAVATALLALERTGSAAAGGMVMAAWMAPHVLAAPAAGVAAERTQRPRLFYCGALAAFGSAIAVLAVLVGRAPLWAVLLAAAVGGSCGPVVTGGLSSLLADLVPSSEDRARAYGQDAVTYSVASVVGPAAAAAVAAASSATLATALLAGAAGTAAAVVLTLPVPIRRDATDLPPSSPPSSPSHPVPRDGEPAGPTGGHRGTATGKTDIARARQVPAVHNSEDRYVGAGPTTPQSSGAVRPATAGVSAGLRALLHVRELRAITMATTVEAFGFAGVTLTAVLLADRLGVPDGGGLLVSLLALGALASASAVAHWPPRVPAAHLARWSLLTTGVSLALAAAVPSFPACAVLFALAGLCNGPLLSTTLRIRAAHAPSEVRTQVFTVGAGLKITAASAGAALTAILADHVAPQALLLGLAGTTWLAATLLYPSPRSSATTAPSR